MNRKQVNVSSFSRPPVADKSEFFLWLNDMTHSRYYWNARAKGWTTEFSEASKFETRNAAEGEAAFANDTTKAEVVVQEMLVPA